MTLNTERTTLHLCMDDPGLADSLRELTLDTGDEKIPLARHTADSLAAARVSNRALAMMSDDSLARVTHYVECNLPSDVARILRVTHRDDDTADQASLPKLHAVKIHVPKQARRRVRGQRARAIDAHPAVRRLGLQAAARNNAEPVALLADLDDLVDTPLDIARSIVFQHPQLASRDGETAAIIIDDHIDTSADLLNLARLISSLGPDGWYEIAPSVDWEGNVLTWGPGWEREEHKEGDPVMQYNLVDRIVGTLDAPPPDSACPSVTKESLRTSQDDDRLQNKKWTVSPGTPDLREETQTQTARLARLAAGDSGGYKFTLNNLTPGYGVTPYAESIAFEPDPDDPGKGTFSIDCLNSYLRTLGSYVRFYDAEGKRIDGVPGSAWASLDPEIVKRIEAGDATWISMLSAVSVILGIPVPTDPTNLEFTWPAEADSCQLMLGGLGTSDWDTDIDLTGTILTGVFQYGVPILFLAAGVAITSSAWYKAFLEDKDLVAAVLGVGFGVVGGAVATAAALMNTKRVLFAFGNAIAGILVSQAAAKLAVYIATRISAAQIANSVPIAGWASRIASMVITAANITETTVQVLMSPATYRIDIKRQLAVEVTIRPDPLAGSETEPPVWPRVATDYQVMVQYRNGTNYTLTGKLPEDPSKRADPLVVYFPELPAGGEIQISCGVYSESKWLAGSWTSSWMRAALPAGGDGPLQVEGAIQQSLVPLSPDTQYLYQSKLTYDSTTGRHAWTNGDQPTAVVTDLSSDPEGHNLAELVDITLNNKAYMLGYCWQASGQNLPFCGSSTPTDGQIYAFQNISGLSNPEAALKFPSCGFSNRPYLVYDQFGPAPLFSLAASFQSDLDKEELTPALREVFAANLYPLPDKAAIEVVTPTARWTMSTGDPAPTYDLRREPGGLISVFSYPTPLFSPNNFYVDPRGEHSHLRLVILGDQTPFDMNAGLSYGYFTLSRLDSVKIHPAGYAIGVSFRDSKMEILQIPAEPSLDADAIPAVPVSGHGIRQGLMRGPVAVTVAADGRILVLESLNRRIQAFDLNGNPAASFVGDLVATLSRDEVSGDLDNGWFTGTIRRAFDGGGAFLSHRWRISGGKTNIEVVPGDNQYGLSDQLVLTKEGAFLSDDWTICDAKAEEPISYRVQWEGQALTVSLDGQPLFDLPLDSKMFLDRGAVDEQIVAAFEEHGRTISLQSMVTGVPLTVGADNAEALDRIEITQSIRDALASRGVILGDDAAVSPSISVRVIEAGAEWTIVDSTDSLSYTVRLDPKDESQLQAYHLDATMKLVNKPADTFLDVAIEALGFIYVLSYTNEGKSVADYRLDLYDPSGKFLSRTPDSGVDPRATGVNGAKLVVDQWRTMYTLNFEYILGPDGRTEPSLSLWNPTTPGG